MNRVKNKPNQFRQPEWYLIDATSKPLGKIATEASILLRGKQKVSFKDYLDCGDHVVIINAARLYLSGSKLSDKKYYSHSGYPGRLKVRSVTDIGFSEAIKKAVYNMLPKNKLRPIWLKRLHIYEGPDHPHQANLAVKTTNGK